MLHLLNGKRKKPIFEFKKKNQKQNNKAEWNNPLHSWFFNYLFSIQFKIWICVYQRVSVDMENKEYISGIYCFKL